MLDPQRPIADYLDDFLHGALSEQDAAHVQAWLDSSPDASAALAAAQRRKSAFAELPSVEASDGLIRSTLDKIERQATKRKKLLGRPVVRGFLALAALALVSIISAQAYYTSYGPTPYSLRMMGQSRLLAGAPAALRVTLVDQQTGQRVPNVPITLAMINYRTQEVVELASFDSSTDLAAAPRFQVPDWPGVDCGLRITAATPTGAEVLEEKIILQRSSKLYLSTDKPIYQPGQTIHVRALALRRPDLKPVAGDEVLFTISDAKDNVIFKQRGQTSKFGIAAIDCPLATELNQGEFRIACTVGDTSSTRTVKVEKYVLPKFKIGIDLDKPFYAPLDKVRGSVSANYFFGKPVVGGQVKLEARTTDVTAVVLNQQTLTTDDKGTASYEFTLPPQLFGREQDGGAARFQVFATVTDVAGQTYTSVTSRRVTDQPIELEVILEGGAPVRDLPNRIYVHASYADGRPAVVDVQVNGEKGPKTNDLGVGTFEVTPKGQILGITLVAKDKDGLTARRNVQLTCGQFGNDFIVRPNKSVYSGGETMTLTAQAGGIEPVFVDFIKDGQTMLSQTIDLKQGQGELVLDLPPDLAGSIQLVAYRFNSNGLAVRKSRLIFVEQARQLKLTTTLDQPEYRPGAKATLKFQLSDSEGKATPGAISLAAVDEAVFAVLNQRPGLEQAFFLAEQALLQPVYTIYPQWMPAPGEVPSPDRVALENAVFALTAYTAGDEFTFDQGVRNDSAPVELPIAATASETPEVVFRDSPFTLVASTYPEKLSTASRTRREGLQAVRVAWFILLGSAFVFGVVTFAVLQPKAFMISAGVLLVLTLCGGPMLLLSAMFLMGGNADFATAEKMAAPGMAWREDFPLEKSEEPPSAMDEGGGTPSAPPRVREFFPETLLWQPELVTDDQGVASLEIDLADSITTWRVSASAVSAAGQLGDAQLPIKVFQPFFVDLNLPVALTRGDEVSIPVVVYNYLDQPQTVKLNVEQRDWFKLLAAPGEDATAQLAQSLDLKPGEVRAVSIRLQVLRVGKQELLVTATAGSVADAIRRTIDVVSNGLLVEAVHNHSFAGNGEAIEVAVDMPADLVPGSQQALVKIHPSGFSQLVEGLDAIFQMPSGCFEQTSSTTYPNVLALDYLRSTRKSAPQVEAKARQFIHLGYQRLVSFEVNGGGFDWFGNPPANRTLTAYGLLEFVDMARVHDVDPDLIQRTRLWLIAQRRGDGTWEPEPHMLNDGLASSVNRSDNATLSVTAYIAWSVLHSSPPQARSPQEQQAYQLTADYLLSHRPASIKDAYVLASVAMALAAFDPHHPELHGYLAQLEALKETAGDLCFWKQPEGAARPFYGDGPSGSVETTAMAALAMLSAKEYAGTTRGALAWLVNNKDARGTWYSTQATVLALKALVAGTQLAGESVERKFTVLVDGEQVRELVIPADQSDVMQQLDLSAQLQAGEGKQVITLKETSNTGSSVQVVTRYHRDVLMPTADPKTEPLSIALVYDRERLNVDETVTATATITNQMNEAAPMVIVDLPIPGGFKIEAQELDELVGSRKIEKYQITARQGIVYVRQLAPGATLELKYRLKATMPVKVAVPPAATYEYYNPARRGASQGARLEAIKA